MIQLTQIGDASISVDLENELVEDSTIVFFNEIERESFQRVVQDITFVVRNQIGQFSTLFAHKPIATRWRVTIVDDAGIAFVGEVQDDSIEFDPKKETCTFIVWSLLKVFWDRAKVNNINAAPNEGPTEPNILYTTVDYILTRELIRASRLVFGTSRAHPYSDLFTKVVTHANFVNRPIRGWAECTTVGRPEVGNNGRYAELAGRPYGNIRNFGSQRPGAPMPAIDTSAKEHTSHYDLLTAFSYYYNAEFYIDFTTESFMMVPRNVILNYTPNNGVPHVLDNITVEDSISVYINDNDKFDYIRYLRVEPRPGKVIFNSYNLLNTTAGLTENTSFIVVEYTTMPDGSVIASSPSPPLDVDIKTVLNKNKPPFGTTKSIGLNLSIPHVAGTTVKLKILYRSVMTNSGVGWYIVTHFDNVTDVIYVTINSDGVTSSQLQARPGSYAAWLGYDQRTNTWYAPIYDVQDGKNQPIGNILNVIPTLRFTVLGKPDELAPESLADMTAFFGGEQINNDYDSITKNQFIGEMISRSRLSCTVEGRAYRIGDAVFPPLSYASELNSNRMFIKRASINENPRVNLSELELVQEVTP